jgi:hypothetical protein
LEKTGIAVLARMKGSVVLLEMIVHRRLNLGCKIAMMADIFILVVLDITENHSWM